MQTEADRIATGLRMTTNRIGTLIRGIRGMNRRGKDASRLTTEYLEQLRRNHLYIVRAEQIEADVSAFEDMAPLPYIDGFVGISETRRKEREWYGVSDFLRDRPAFEPVRFLEAAE